MPSRADITCTCQQEIGFVLNLAFTWENSPNLTNVQLPSIHVKCCSVSINFKATLLCDVKMKNELMFPYCKIAGFWLQSRHYCANKKCVPHPGL